MLPCLGSFDYGRSCPKCNAKEANSEWLKECSDLAEVADGCVVFREGIVRTCHRCGYQWVEKALDAKEGA